MCCLLREQRSSWCYKHTVFLAKGSHLIKDCFHPVSTVAFLWYCSVSGVSTVRNRAKFNSIIDNAIKHTCPDNNVVVCLRINITLEEQPVKVCFQDTAHVYSIFFFFSLCILVGGWFARGHNIDCLNKMVDLRCVFVFHLSFSLSGSTGIMPQYHSRNTHTYTSLNMNLSLQCNVCRSLFPLTSGFFPHFLPFALILASPLLILLSAVTLQVCALYLHTLGALFSQQGLVQAQ